MIASVLLFLFQFVASGHYKSFKVAVYAPAHEVVKMANRTWLEETWKIITDQVQIDKIYLETHRDGRIVDDNVMEDAKKFFRDRNVETAGGITYTFEDSETSEAGQTIFNTFCMSNQSHRDRAKLLAEITARHHDAFILDDFFFTSCKSDVEIDAKGGRTWSDYRRAIMADAGRELVVKAAHAVNPNVTAIIKYPNWYDHFPGLGFDLEAGPKIFDGIWTGTETRNPDGTQHLQNYLSYEVIRYFENIAPGRNGGGWVDTFDIDRPSLGGDRYAEQLWLTMFAKPKELSLFAYNLMYDSKLNASLHRTYWQGQGSSFDWDNCTADFVRNGTRVHPTTFARIAGCVFESIDSFIGNLGTPLGIKSYNPPNSLGDDFLQNFLGMIGLPIEMVPDYPVNATTVLLTAQAADDPDFATKMGNTIRAGGDVFITSGLIARAPEKVSQIVELAAKKDIVINNFSGNLSTKDILMKQIWYQTNDAWEIVSAGRPLIDGYFGVPIVLRGLYGEKGGSLYALAVPEDFGDLYDYPAPILDAIRSIFSRELGIYILGPSKVSLFVYDNNYFIVENFNDVGVNISVVLDKAVSITEEGANRVYNSPDAHVPVEIHLNPHQYRVFHFSPK